MQSFLHFFYLPIVLLVFAWLLLTFVNDRSTPKTDLRSWLVLLVASALWPIIAPKLSRILFRKIARLSRSKADQTAFAYRSTARMKSFEQGLQK